MINWLIAQWHSAPPASQRVALGVLVYLALCTVLALLAAVLSVTPRRIDR